MIGFGRRGSENVVAPLCGRRFTGGTLTWVSKYSRLFCGPCKPPVQQRWYLLTKLPVVADSRSGTETFVVQC